MIRDFFLAALVYSLAIGVIIYAGLRFRSIRKEVRKNMERQEQAKQNPYTPADFQFMVDAGMTPEQIQKAIANALRNNR